MTAPIIQPHDPGGKTRIAVPKHWEVQASFDGEGDCFRYRLSHRWSDGPMVLWAMMNPSTADSLCLDPTVAKTARMAQLMGFGGQFIANAAGYRATDKTRLLTVDDPIGPGNYEAIKSMAAESSLIVIAHGRLPGGLQHLAGSMCEVIQGTGAALHILRLTYDGIPMHPLARGKGHIPITTTPQAWRYQK
jgi:hypothetical protein